MTAERAQDATPTVAATLAERSARQTSGYFPRRLHGGDCDGSRFGSDGNAACPGTTQQPAVGRFNATQRCGSEDGGALQVGSAQRKLFWLTPCSFIGAAALQAKRGHLAWVARIDRSVPLAMHQTAGPRVSGDVVPDEAMVSLAVIAVVGPERTAPIGTAAKY